MKIVYVIPGFGGTFYCQNCAYSMGLVQGFKNLPHTAVLAPMYIPFIMDRPFEPDAPIFYGALNVYLKEKFSLLRHMPRWLENLLNSRPLLRWIADKSASTDPAGLEEMTIEVMKGEDGRHRDELGRLVSWLKDSAKPDIVHLSNALLIGIAITIKKELDIPVFCNLDDENAWLDEMREPYSSQGWDLIRDGAKIIDRFISASDYYAELVRSRIDVPEIKIQVVPKGIPVDEFVPAAPAFDPSVIGFMSRMSEPLGLDILVDAFILLKERSIHKDLKLRITGGIAPADRKFIRRIKKKLINRALDEDVEFEPYLYQNDKKAFFDSLTLMSVPARKGEAFGGFMLEAMASGIPVVQPKLGGYPEIIENTGGGIVYENNTPTTLAETLSGLLAEPDRIMKMSQQGLTAVRETYSAGKIIGDLLKLYEDCACPGPLSRERQEP